MIEDIISRSALLVALLRAGSSGVALSALESAIAEFERHLGHLRSLGLSIVTAHGMVILQSPVSFDLYQSVPPEIRDEVEKIADGLAPPPPVVDSVASTRKAITFLAKRLEALEKEPKPLDVGTADGQVRWLGRGNVAFPIACIHCHEPACFTSGIEAFGPTDAFPSRVCPADIIRVASDGLVSIERERCTGCMLYVVRCPISVIALINGVAVKPEYLPTERWKPFIEIRNVSQPEKRQVTDSTLSRLTRLLPPFNLGVDIKGILDNFEARSGSQGLNWAQDQYYVWVRNCLRELRVDAAYTGSAGKLKRADVTIRNPFLAGIEVKSPAEGDITVGAIRQAVDAAREVSEAFKGKGYPAVIGPDIARGSHARALSWERNYGVKVPLIRGRCLLYLMLKHKTSLPQDPVVDVERLFKEFSGWIGREELTAYFASYFEIRRSSLREEEPRIPLPVGLAPGTDSSREHALASIERAIAIEIDRCFPDPDRTARGGYSTD